MQPWWDSTLLWSGVGVVVAAILAAIVAIVVIARIGANRTRPKV
jgi:hypothetical protein